MLSELSGIFLRAILLRDQGTDHLIEQIGQIEKTMIK